MTPISYRSSASGLYPNSTGFKSPPKPSDFNLSTDSGRKAVRQALGNRDADPATLAMILQNTIDSGTVYELDIITDDLRRGVSGHGSQTDPLEFILSQKVRDLLSAKGIVVRLERAGFRFNFKQPTEVQESVIENSYAQMLFGFQRSRWPQRHASIDQSLSTVLPKALTDIIYAYDEEKHIPISEYGNLYIVDVMNGNDRNLKRKVIQSAVYQGCVPYLNSCFCSSDREGMSMNLAGVDLSGLVLRNFDFTGADLTGANLQDSDLVGGLLNSATLKKANLTGADLTRTRMSGADLSGSKLTGAKLFQTQFMRANLTDANLKTTKLTKCDLSFANLDGAKFVAASLTEVDLTGCTLRKTDMSWATFVLTDLTKLGASEVVLNNFRPDSLRLPATAYYSGSPGQPTLTAPLVFDLFDRSSRVFREVPQSGQMAIVPENSGRIISELAGEDVVVKRKIIDMAVHQSAEQYLNSVFEILRKLGTCLNLEGVDLSDLDLRKFDFSGAKLKKANLSRSNLLSVNLVRADLSDAKLNSACLTNCDLRNSDLSRCDLMGSDLINANLSQAILIKAVFRGANLSEANLTGVKTLNTCFSYCKLNGTDMTGADLLNSTMYRADLSSAKMSRLKLKGVELSYSILKYTEFFGADLTEAYLIGVDLSRAYLADANLPKLKPAAANVTGADSLPNKIRVDGSWDDSCSIL